MTSQTIALFALALALALIAIVIFVASTRLQAEQSQQRLAARQKRCCCKNITATATLSVATVAAAGAWETYKETQRQANSAEQQVQLSRDQERVQLRAYVGLAKIADALHRDDLHQFEFRFTLKNFGSTPTVDLRVATYPPAGSALPAPLFFLKKESADINLTRSLLEPQQEVQSRLIVVNDADVVAVNAGTKHIYVWATATYYDIFPGSELHITVICRELSQLVVISADAFAGSWKTCDPQGDCADFECKRRSP